VEKRSIRENFKEEGGNTLLIFHKEGKRESLQFFDSKS
jgi:hypothetical protein